MQSFYPREMDGASQTSLRTPSSNRSAFTSRRYSDIQSIPRGIPHSATAGQLPLPGPAGRTHKSSATWTSSSGDLAGLSDSDEIHDRPEFVHEYNKLARKHGVRMLVSEDCGSCLGGQSPQQPRRGWFSRTFLRQASAGSNASSAKSDRRVRHKRSVSDLAMHIVQLPKRDSLKDEDLQSLVRLCGKSMLYLPSEYAASSLILPTCFRATAQYLVQHAADTRGVFRIPGSVRVVNALYDYYCADGGSDEIASTTRCPNLPTHIKVGTHDVASAFKRFLSGLPGGILGSLSLFDALVAIHSQLKGDPEFTRTKQSKLRARLIALAIGSVKSQFRRELICSVFGLLCLIGRTAETAPREDEQGRPLPTADLMGYNALGIVFGPLLVGELINTYTMRIANPPAGLALFPVTPPQTRREKRKSKMSDEEDSRMLSVDKIHVANAIAEMLITHWREVVKQMRSLGALKLNAEEAYVARGQAIQDPVLRPSASESFVIKQPAEWSSLRPPSAPRDMSESPVPPSPTPEARRSSGRIGRPEGPRSSFVVQRSRPKGARSLSNSRGCVKAPVQFLSPTAEEPPYVDFEQLPNTKSQIPRVPRSAAPMEEPHLQLKTPPEISMRVLHAPTPIAYNSVPPRPADATLTENVKDMIPKDTAEVISSRLPSRQRRLVVSKDSIIITDGLEPPPPSEVEKPEQNGEPNGRRSPSRLSLETTADVLGGGRRSRRSTESVMSGSKDDRFRTTISKLRKSLDQAETSNFLGEQRRIAQTEKVSNINSSDVLEAEDEVHWKQEAKSGGSGLRRSKLPTYKPKHLRGKSEGARSPAGGSHSTGKKLQKSHMLHGSGESLIPSDNPEPKVMRFRDGQHQQCPAPVGDLRKHPISKAMRAERLPRSGGGSLERTVPANAALGVNHIDHETKFQHDRDSSVETVIHEPNYDQNVTETSLPGPVEKSPEHKGSGRPATPEPLQRHSATKAIIMSRIRSTTPSPTRSLPGRQSGSAVKAMAARFENASKETAHIPSPMHTIFKPNGVLSRYMINPSPTKEELDESGRLGSARPSRQSLVEPPSEGGTRSSTEMMYEDDTASKDGSIPIGDARDSESGQGQWIRRDVAPPKSEDSISLHSVSKSGTKTHGNTVAQPGKAFPASMKITIGDRITNSSKSSQELDRRTDGTKHAVSFPATGESDSPSRRALISNPSSPKIQPHRLETPESASQMRESSSATDILSTSSPTPSSRNLALRAQIRNLQGQVAAKVAETKQLQRLLDLGQNTDVAMLREQLRLTERECAMWRERAEVAERRVESFKRLCANLRKLKETDVEERKDMDPEMSNTAANRATTGDGVLDDESETVGKSRIVELWLDGRQRESSAGHTEDEATVTKRIRFSLMAMEDGIDEMEDKGRNKENRYALRDRTAEARLPPPQLTYQPSYRSSTSEDEGRLSATVASMWMAAEQILEQGQGSTGHFRRKRTE